MTTAKGAMGDAEVVATWMEPRPDRPAHGIYRPQLTNGGWWEAGFRPHREWDLWYPAPLTLDRLHLVEERLTDEQWGAYADLLAAGCGDSALEEAQAMIHATAAQKLAALAAVIRSVGDAAGGGE